MKKEPENRGGVRAGKAPRLIPALRARYGAWSSVALVYLAVSAPLHLGWEFAQLPFYTLFWQEPVGTIIYSVVHCTLGDMIISTITLFLAIGITKRKASTDPQVQSVMLRAITLGVAYTVFSEWLNVEVRHTWSYTNAMPRLPPLGTGLTPTLQWLIVPSLASWLTVRGSHSRRG